MTFDKNNNIFEFNSGESEALFIYIIFESLGLKFELLENGISIISFSIFEPGDALIYSIKKHHIYTIQLIYTKKYSNSDGIIWINPSNKELKVDLTQKYQWKYDYVSFIGVETKLIYTIEKSEKNVTFIFRYNSEMELDDESIVSNPFVVCQGEVCKDNISTYDFVEGESYKIYAKVIKRKIDSVPKYILSSYYFCDKINVSFDLIFNFWNLSLLLFIL